MTADLEHPQLSRELERLAPYVRGLMDAASSKAVHLHSDQVDVTHVLHACMTDEECAANEAVSYAFADPETIAFELLALTPGLMVVTSKAVLPFSSAAIRAFTQARQEALQEGAGELGLGRILAHCAAHLPATALTALQKAGWQDAPTTGPKEGALQEHGHLFQGLSSSAKQALSRACKSAAREGQDDIPCGHLMRAALEVEGELATQTGFTAARIRSLLGTQEEAAAALRPSGIPAADGLVLLLKSLPQGGDSLDLLKAAMAGASPELAVLFQRHRLTPELLERARAAFQDP